MSLFSSSFYFFAVILEINLQMHEIDLSFYNY